MSLTLDRYQILTIRSLSRYFKWDTVLWLAHSLTSAVVLFRVFLPNLSTYLEDAMATVPDDPIPPVLGEDGQPLSPKLSERYNEDVVLFTDKDGKERRAVVTVSLGVTLPTSLGQGELTLRALAEVLGRRAKPGSCRRGGAARSTVHSRKFPLRAPPSGLMAGPAGLTPNMLVVQLPAGYLEVLLPEGTRTQVLESTTTLIDKGFLRGDIIRARRAAGASTITPRGQLGQVVDLKTEVQLQRVLTGDEIEGWFPATDLVAASRINHGDHVVHGDWIGVVEEVFEMAMIEVGNNGIVRRVCDIGNTFSVGAATDTIKQMLLERGEGLLAAFLGATDFKRVRFRPCLT